MQHYSPFSQQYDSRLYGMMQQQWQQQQAYLQQMYQQQQYAYYQQLSIYEQQRLAQQQALEQQERYQSMLQRYQSGETEMSSEKYDAAEKSFEKCVELCGGLQSSPDPVILSLGFSRMQLAKQLAHSLKCVKAQDLRARCDAAISCYAAFQQRSSDPRSQEAINSVNAIFDDWQRRDREIDEELATANRRLAYREREADAQAQRLNQQKRRTPIF